MDDAAIYVAVITGSVTLVSLIGVPIVTAHLVGRSKQQDWTRQDAMAKATLDAAALVADKTAEVARTLKASETNTNNKLDKIHGLVNSQYLEVKKLLLVSYEVTLALQNNAQPRDADAVAATTTRISMLKQEIAAIEATTTTVTAVTTVTTQ